MHSDTFYMLIVAAPALLAVLYLMFSIKLSPQELPPPQELPGPSPVLMVEREQLLLALNLELHAVEMRLRGGSSAATAEGASLMRTCAVEFLKNYRP